MTDFHCAYKVSEEDIVTDAPTAYAVPDPSGAVFHPSKVKPVVSDAPAFTKFPVLPEIVPLAEFPDLVGNSKAGADPPVFPLPK
jgi:hypothetical protein